MQTINETSVRWAIALVAFFALFAGVVAGAQAATGGAAAYSPPATASSEEDLTFGSLALRRRQLVRTGPLGPLDRLRSDPAPGTMGVAHKTLPCGTTVKFVYHGRAVVTQVIDRGPYVDGRAWDLTKAASDALGFEGVGRVRYAVALDDAAAASQR